MIITMTKVASKSKLMINRIATVFQKGGFDILIRNGQEKAVVAALGLGDVDPSIISRLAGIEKIDKSNDLFNSTNGKDFVEMHDFFRGWD